MIGAALKARRLAKGWTQEELADWAGVNVITISRLERDKNRPDIDTLRRLAKAFDVPLIELLEPRSEVA